MIAKGKLKYILLFLILDESVMSQPIKIGIKFCGFILQITRSKFH